MVEYSDCIYIGFTNLVISTVNGRGTDNQSDNPSGRQSRFRKIFEIEKKFQYKSIYRQNTTDYYESKTVSMCMCVWVCVYGYMCACVYVGVSIRVCLCMYMCVFVCI